MRRRMRISPCHRMLVFRLTRLTSCRTVFRIGCPADQVSGDRLFNGGRSIPGDLPQAQNHASHWYFHGTNMNLHELKYKESGGPTFCSITSQHVILIICFHLSAGANVFVSIRQISFKSLQRNMNVVAAFFLIWWNTGARMSPVHGRRQC